MFGLFAYRCDFCGTFFRRNKYRWTIQRKTVWICPSCNSKLERQKSKAAFDPAAEITVPNRSGGKRSGCGGCSSTGCLVVIGIGLLLAVVGSLLPKPESKPVQHSVPEIPPKKPTPAVKPATINPNKTTTNAPQKNDRRERAAASRLRLALQFEETGKTDTAKRWLAELIAEFPDTEAAKTAKQKLGGLK